MRTLALLPPVLAIKPSRIRIWRVTKLFQPSVVTKNLRSTSSGIELFRFSSDVEVEHRIEVPAAGRSCFSRMGQTCFGRCADCHVAVVAATCKTGCSDADE